MSHPTGFLALFSMPGGWEMVVIILAIVFLFGGKKIPELAQGIGKGIREFKKALSDDAAPKDKTNSPE